MSPHKKSEGVEVPPNHYPAWSPRFWHGMRAGCWWRLLASNGFRVAWPRLHIAFGVSVFTPVNDLLAIIQATIFGRRIASTTIAKPPVFILGHWRSGTTLLHELLVTNPSFASPNTFQCFAPSHFLLSEPLMVRFGGCLLPKHRPMDNMQAGWTLPQEDEFALMNLGVPSPYLRIAFPGTHPEMLAYFDLEGLSEDDLAFWRERFVWFLKVLTYHHNNKQLVLKSPTHTGRIAELARMFPGAKFIHLTREPTQLFSSTLRLWRSLESVQALQDSPNEQRMAAYVTACHNRMYAGFEQGRREIDPARIVDVQYEQLAAEPFQTVKGLYEALDLGDFEAAEFPLRERLADHANYQPNRHVVDPDLQRQVYTMWSEYSKRYGYSEASGCM